MSTLRTAAAYLMALLLAVTGLTACSSSTTTDAAPKKAAGSFPVTVTAANGPVTISAPPQRIVSLSPTATEDLFAIGAGSQVVAADKDSNYPANAPRTSLSGTAPSIEAIARYNPQLVVVSDDIGGVVASLTTLKVPVLLQPAATSFDEVYAQLTTLGTATGHRAPAAAAVSGMKAKIAAALARKPSRTLTYYYEIDPTYYSATSATFIGRVFSLFGMKSIADPADKQHTGYPQLSAEYIVRSAPDYIFLADSRCCGQSASTVAARPAWSQVPAVHDGRVIALDDDIATRWGPRLVDLVQTVSATVSR